MIKANEIAQQHGVDDLPLWRDQLSHEVLLDALSKHGVDEEIFARLISAYRINAHKQRIHTTVEFDEIFQSINEKVL